MIYISKNIIYYKKYIQNIKSILFDYFIFNYIVNNESNIIITSCFWINKINVIYILFLYSSDKLILVIESN